MTGPLKKRWRAFVVLAGALITLGSPLGPARAQCTDCGCELAAHATTDNLVTSQHGLTRQHISDEFAAQRDWLLNDVWLENLLPAVQMMAEQIAGTAMLQTTAVGSFFDAKQQLEAQALTQRLTAAAHKDYQPSAGLCTFGTNTRSLAESERRGQFAAFVLSQRSQDRQMGNMNASGADGSQQDLAARLDQFKIRYCDTNENNRGLEKLCGVSSPAGTINKDIDYNRTMGAPETLKIDFAEPSISGDEEDVLALNNNLYAHTLFNRIPPAILNDANRQPLLLDMRALVAKRSVVENSFHTIAGLKAQGSPAGAADTARYMAAIIKDLGISDREIPELLGDRPSYFAQMDILTKKLYQRPEFYTDLYDTPANVGRKGAALEAVNLMQSFDLWQSYLRTEAMLSVWLELELAKHQDDIQNRINKMTDSGPVKR